MSLRQKAIQATEIGIIHHVPYLTPSMGEAAMDALLDWIDTNAERIADDPDYAGDAWIRYLVKVLRQDTDD